MLRQQLIIMERHLNKPVGPSRIEKLTLVVITAKFKVVTGQSSAQLRAVIRKTLRAFVKSPLGVKKLAANAAVDQIVTAIKRI